MARVPLVPAALAAVLLAGCSQPGSGGAPTPPATTVGGASPTASAPASPTAAPSSAAPSSAAPTASGPTPRSVPGERTEVATGLRVPWVVAFLPDGSALVTLRDEGRVVRIAGGRVSDAGTVPGVDPGGEGGLLGIAVSPTFETDRFVFVHHTAANDNRVVRLRLEGDRLVPDRVIVEGIRKGTIHNGGRLAFGPDGMLYVGTGEAGQRALSQDRDDLAGKILRVTMDGEPAPGNPFGTRVFSMGHRNVQGLAWRGQALYATEFGQDTFDELNEIRPGGNHGWPEVEGRAGNPAYVDPVQQWTTDEASPSGMAIVGDTAYVAALKGQRLWVVDLATGQRRAVENELGRIRDVVVAPDGRLWVVTSNTFRGQPRPGDDRIIAMPPP